MAEGSVAPKERVNIVYKSSVGDQTEEVELPLKLLMVGDYTGKSSDETVEDRAPVNIDKELWNAGTEGGAETVESTLSISIGDDLLGGF